MRRDHPVEVSPPHPTDLRYDTSILFRRGLAKWQYGDTFQENIQTRATKRGTLRRNMQAALKLRHGQR